MLSTMSRCPNYFWNFQNGHRCHGNGQNAKKLKNTKMIIAGYSPNRNKEQHPHLVERDKPKKSESVGQTFPQLPWKQKGGNKKKLGFLSSNFIKLWGGLKKFKMAAIAMVTKVQKMLNSNRTADPFET